MKARKQSRCLWRFAVDTTAAIALSFAVVLPVVIASVGLSTDLSLAYLMRQRLSGALDAAALSASAVSTDEAEMEALAQAYFEVNYPDGKIGTPYNLSVLFEGDEITVSAYADYPTSFLRVLGIQQLTVFSSTTVHREIKGLEVVLVLDNTGSMGVSNMNALKTASSNFVNILFDRAAEPEDIKIGMVPYSSSVRVGRYGLGQFPDGSAGYGTPFVTLPPGMSFTNNKNHASNWFGCIVEHHETNYNSTATHVANSRGQLWTTHASGVCSNNANCRGHGYAPGSSTNDPYPDDTHIDDYQGPWDIYMYGKIIANGEKCTDTHRGVYNEVLWGSFATSRCSSCNPSSYHSSTRDRCNTAYCFCWHSVPNVFCPEATIVPLSSDRDFLLSSIQTMTHDGATISNIGMAWGMRVLSPDFPFEEGANWDDEDWNKAVLLMTDGDVSLNFAASTAYQSAYQYRNSLDNSVLEDRLLEVCNNMKDRGVIIYSVVFDHATVTITNATKQIYRNCATSPSHYFDAPGQAELVAVFEKISGALANLHISR